jgi:hypothetical protein
MTRRSALLAGLPLLLLLSAAAPAAPYEPERGSPERTAILDGLRSTVADFVGGHVGFLVSALRVDQGWAFVVVEPQWPNGKPIDPAAIGLDMSARSGLTTYALLRRRQESWTLVDWAIGPRDPIWRDWWRDYGAPREIFPK